MNVNMEVGRGRKREQVILYGRMREADLAVVDREEGRPDEREGRVRR